MNLIQSLKLAWILLNRNFHWLIIKLQYAYKPLRRRVNDYQLYLYPNRVGLDIKESNIYKQLALDGTREVAATKVMPSFISPGDIILEAGANIGYYTIMMAQLIEKKGKIFALEPDPDNYIQLVRNLELNKIDQSLVQTKQLGVADSVGEMQFYVTRNSNLHSMVKPKDPTTIKHVETIKTTTIDAFASAHTRPNVIRMDVEGFEVHIINGMANLLKSPEPLKMFIELHPQIIGADQTVDMLQTLKQSGFKTHTVITRDTYIRAQLNQATSQNMTIDQLISHPGITQAVHSFEVFFIR